MKGRSLLRGLLASNVLLVVLTLGVVGVLAGDGLRAGTWFASLVLMSTVAIGAAALLGRVMSRPLDAIADVVTRIAHEEAPPAGPPATRSLAAAVNRMAEDFVARIAELQAEGALREGILSSMSEAVLVAEANTVIYANPAASEMFGAGAGAPLPPMIRDAGASEPAAEFALHHPVRRMVRATTLRLPTGQTLVVAQDVTEARRIERIRRDFVADASHEMKTPLAGILATAETLQDAVHEDPDAAARFATTLVGEARRLSMLVTDLLDLARLDQAPSTAADPIDLSTLATQTVALFNDDAARSGVSLAMAIAPGVSVDGRGEDLVTLIRNLLENAFHYTPSGGSITVTLTEREGVARLEVEDTGAGIPTKDVPRIFERFYRVDRARARETGGTGLGLAIVKHVAESHGGDVSVTSQLGAGSRFMVTLPQAAVR